MAEHLVSVQDVLHENEASQALMSCFDNATPDKSCFVMKLAVLFCCG